MGFKVIKLTKEERDLFRERKIENPNWQKRIGGNFAVPLYITIDKDRDIILFSEGELRDDPYIKFFVYI